MGRKKFQLQSQEVQGERQKQVKLELCTVVRRVALRHGLTQKELASLLGTSQSYISRIVRCRLEDISYGQLVRFATALPEIFDLHIVI